MEDDQLFSIAEKKSSQYHNDYRRVTYSLLGVSIKDNTIEREGKDAWSVEWILNTYLNYVRLSVIVSPNNSAAMYHGVLSRLLYIIRVGKTKDLKKINDLIDNINLFISIIIEIIQSLGFFKSIYKLFYLINSMVFKYSLIRLIYII